ncbi:PREDICTED: uncharacterized protein C4orf26 homolog [Chrysochloris asiatica]|uniref:Uncharacterized protein C4orf26 homolog n=1 Tax=Chrysochloris asiatica TaxID=185453 RepID=A0A9B0TZN6_CHRAS|nr:PREDICTED: uncharacterized protein C4orf26 homolog [Chrysochloris asiatica]
MAGRLCFSCWFLVCCLVVTGSEGQEVTPRGGSQNNGDSTDCQIFTLTPPPITRNLVTNIQPIPRTPKYFPRRYLQRGSSSSEEN